MKVAIIGAGLAGLSAARVLQDAGHDCTVYDKGRGPGGRLSTRRATTKLGDLKFDHGAQFFTARHPDFMKQVSAWKDRGVVDLWQGEFACLEIGKDPEATSAKDRYVGTPSMNEIIKAMAQDRDVHWLHRAKTLQKDAHAWSLTFETGAQAGAFDAVLVAVPAEQVADLVQSVAPDLAAEAEEARSAPCWTAMLAFNTAPPVSFVAAEIKGGALSWIARNNSKPGRDAPETWVLQASPDWSDAHIEDSPEQVSSALVTEFQGLTGAGTPDYVAAHRWRYARVVQPADTPSAWDADLRLGLCGDWRIGARIEDAWLSGRHLAMRILGE